jgi:cytochrome b561
VAVLILANIFLGLIADHIPDEYVRFVIDLHKSFGITVLGLVLLRILWRIGHPPPPIPAYYSPLERRAAHAAHWLLYVVILALPVTGWMHDSAWKEAASHPMSLYWLVPCDVAPKFYPVLSSLRRLDLPGCAG